jgi:hypothetical protein
MGIIVHNYTTNEGFLVPDLYIQVNSIRMLKTLSGPTYGMVYGSLAYKSVTDKDNGASPIAIPNYLANVEEYLTANQFYDQTIFGFAYDAIKRAWQNAGYTVEDWYPHPPTPTTYIYDCSGYSFQGYNCAGYDRDGYDRQGFNKDGWDRQGYGRDGYNAAGYDRDGFDRQGYDIDGYDRSGYNAAGYDRQGYDREGYDAEGYDRQGCNRNHQDKDGNPCPTPAPPSDLSGNTTDLSGNTTDLSGNGV